MDDLKNRARLKLERRVFLTFFLSASPGFVQFLSLFPLSPSCSQFFLISPSCSCSCSIFYILLIYHAISFKYEMSDLRVPSLVAEGLQMVGWRMRRRKVVKQEEEGKCNVWRE